MEPEDTGSQRGKPPDGPRDHGQPAVLQPTLRAFYAADRPKTGDWLKALKQAKLTTFATQDIESILIEIETLDPVLHKTVLLAGIRNAPHAVHRWVDRLVVNLLKAMMDENVDGPVIDSRRISQLLIAKAFDLRAKNKRERRRAENILRLVIGQHLDGRQHLLGPILLALGTTLAKSGKGRGQSWAHRVERKLRKATIPAMATMGAVWAFAHEWAEEIRGERDRLRVENGRLERLLEERQADVDEQVRLRAGADERNSTLTGEMADARRRHAEQLQVAHHEAADVRDKGRTFLDGRLRSLLEDAMAGVEIAGSDATQTKMALGVAGDRLRAAIKVVGEEVQWLKSSA